MKQVAKQTAVRHHAAPLLPAGLLRARHDRGPPLRQPVVAPAVAVGEEVVAEASGDGRTWVRVDRGSKDFPLPRKLKVGVFAESVADLDFEPVFDQFNLTRGK